MSNDNLSANESLQLIESMINKAKDRFSENGHLYLLWGWVIFFCGLTQFVFIRFQIIERPEMVWIATWLAMIYQIVYLIRHKKREAVKTYTDEIGDFVWIAFGVMLFLLMFHLGRTNSWEMMFPLLFAVYGMPTFVSGVILRLPALKWGGVSCWILSLVAAFTPQTYQLLLLCVAMVLAWIIPGYQLRNKYNKTTA